MRKIVAGLYVSVDGVVEAPDAWTGPYFSPEIGQVVGSLIAGGDTLLLGRAKWTRRRRFSGGLAMRFLMTVNGGGRPPDEQLYADMGRFVEELTRAGVLLATGGLDRGTHVIASGGNIALTDGPFTESKEVIVSFALMEVRSKDEALELARRFWKLVGDGEGDIRQVFGPGS